MNRRVLLVLAAMLPLAAQEKRTRLDVEHYQIEAEINPRTQSLNATAAVRFQPLEDTTSAVFDLNNSLQVSRVTDGSGR